MTFPSDMAVFSQILLPFSSHASANQWCMPRWLLCPCLWTSPSKQANYTVKKGNKKKRARQQNMPTMCSHFQRCNDFLFSHVNCQINIRPRRPRPSRIRSPNLPPPGFRLPRAMKIALSNTKMPICGQDSNLGWKQRNLNWLLGRLKWFHVLTYHGVLSQKNDQKSSNLAIWANCFHHNTSLMWHDHSTSFDLQIAYIQIDGCCEYKYVAIFESGTNERLISRL